MARSMTGYGVAEAAAAEVRLTAEIRSVNSRYCEVSVRLPRTLGSFEQRVRKLVQGRMGRGRISVTVTWNGEGSAKGETRINEEVADRYYSLLSDLKKRYKLKGDLDLSTMVDLPDLFASEAPKLDEEEAWNLVREVVDRAVDGANAMREKEGEQLSADLAGRAAAVEDMVEAVEERAPLRVEEARDKLRDRLSQLMNGDEGVDPSRLALEVALIADRLDCTEECVRLRGHCRHFLSALREEGAGRKLNFLLQEMNREANTIGSKASDLGISEQVILMKEEIEKIREQAQNIE
jgi:uncharacterized protein (TIGR00255 family)